MIVKGYAKSVIGSREGNQDSFLVWNEAGIYAVADGVGGGMRGEVASRLATEGVRNHPMGSTDLKATFEKIQETVYADAMANIGEALMGTTLTAVMVKDDEARVCHVGDSRCYLYADGHYRQLTVDHEIYDENLKSPVLASYMGIPTDIHPLTIFEDTVPVAPGNRLLLCSDGLYRQVTEARVAELIREKGATPEALLEQLCAEATADAYSDNVTVVYVEIG